MPGIAASMRDLHCHSYPFGSGIGIPAAQLAALQGTTTVVSAGDAGANNFAAWRRFVASGSASASATPPSLSRRAGAPAAP